MFSKSACLWGLAFWIGLGGVFNPVGAGELEYIQGFTPNPLEIGRPAALQLYSNPCGGFAAIEELGLPSVRLVGDTLQVRVGYFQDAITCQSPGNRLDVPLGLIDPGARRIELYGVSIGSVQEEELLETLAVTVVSPPRPIPAASAWSIAGLALLLGMAAAISRRRRRHA